MCHLLWLAEATHWDCGAQTRVEPHMLSVRLVVKSARSPKRVRHLLVAGSSVRFSAVNCSIIIGENT